MSKASKIIISVLTAIGLCAVLWQFLNIREFTDTIRNVSLTWLGLTVIFFFIYQWLRTLRFSLLADAGGWPLFNTMCLHSFFNNTLPAGLGEAALIYLLKRMHGVIYSSGVASLMTARFMDLAVFSVLFLGIAVSFKNKIPEEVYFVMIGILCVLIIAAILFKALASFEIKPINNTHHKIKNILARHYNALADEFRKIGKNEIWIKLVLYTVGMWFSMYLFFLTTIYSLGYSLSWYSIMMLYLILFPINLLPVKGFGNFGTHEGAWFISLQILGLNTTDAAILGFGSHLVFLFVIFLFSLIPFSQFIYLKSKNPSAASRCEK
jgi:uncharacterized protein (TIRG00374 family)